MDSSRDDSQLRLTRALRLLGSCYDFVIHARDEQRLFEDVCRQMVDYGGYLMAWVGFAETGVERRVRPVAHSGHEEGYLGRIRITWSDTAEGRGPTGTAIRTGTTQVNQDCLTNPRMQPWRQAALEQGYQASIALPLREDGRAFGALTIYAREPNAFNPEEVRLLEELVEGLVYGVQSLRTEAARREAAGRLLESESKYRRLVENLPDTVYIYSSRRGGIFYSGRAETLLGYSLEHLYAHPFLWNESIHPDDREIVARAIREAGENRVFSVEYRLRDAAGNWKWVQDRAMEILTQDGESLIEGFAHDITEKKQTQDQLAYLAHFDQLTGLPNRVLLQDHFDYALHLARRSTDPVAVMFLDLDHFKDVNDTLGHSAGDALLVEVARRIRGGMRAVDTVSRLGGDEFIFILPGCDANGAGLVADKLLVSIASPCRIGPHELVITPSIGIAMYPDDGLDMETLSQNADAAMYQAKQGGRNGYRFFTQAMQVHSMRNLKLNTELRQALARNQLSLQYQPQIDLRDGRVVGVEALLRWRHPELGEVAPSEFIPVAENMGLIVSLGEWVLRTAVAQLKAWLDLGLPPMQMAVNLSAAQFRHAQLVESVSRILAAAGLPPGLLELELTEAVAMGDPAAAMAVMDGLSARGVRLSIDDFGTGYSSLGHLKRFRIYKLKIDQSFVRNVPDDPEDIAIVTTVIGLARSLGLRTIAEGVETEAQAAFLKARGCDEVQGYHYSRPLDAQDLEAFLRRVGDGRVA